MKTSLTTLFIIPLEWNAFFAVLHKDAAMFALIKCSGWTGTTVNCKYSSKWWTGGLSVVIKVRKRFKKCFKKKMTKVKVV